MAKLNFNDAFSAVLTPSGKFRGVVADATALAAIGTPLTDDYAWQVDTAALKKYDGAAWQTASSTDTALFHISGGSINAAYDEIDTTDTETAAGFKDSLVARQEIQVTLDTILRNGSGVKLTGAGMSLVYDGSSVPVKTVQYGVQYDEINMTDSGTTAGFKEFSTDRASRTLQIAVIMRNDSADLELGASNAATLTLATGVTLAGNLTFTSKSPGTQGQQASEVQYNGTFQGTVTPANVLDYAGLTKDLLFIFDDNRTYSGSYVGLGTQISGDIEGDLTAQHTGRISGAMTETND